MLTEEKRGEGNIRRVSAGGKGQNKRKKQSPLHIQPKLRRKEQRQTSLASSFKNWADRLERRKITGREDSAEIQKDHWKNRAMIGVNRKRRTPGVGEEKWTRKRKVCNESSWSKRMQSGKPSHHGKKQIK